PPFARPACADEAVPEQAAIARAEMKLADQSRFAKRMETGPLVAVVGDRSLVEVEANNVAPVGAGFDRFGGPPGKTAAEIEVIWIMAMQGLGDGAKVGVRKPPSEGCQIADQRGIIEARRRPPETRPAQLLPRVERNAPGLCQAL